MLKQIANLSLLIAAFIIAVSCNSKGTAETSKPDKPAVDTSFHITRIDTCNVDQLKARGYVNDFTFLFDEGEQWFLDSLIRDNEKRTTNQITIVTIDSTTLRKCSIHDFATALGKQWGVGQKEKNNGIVIAICLQKRQIGIATGYGIEKLLSNEETKSIIDNIIVPEFKKNNYFEGTRKGLIAIIEKTKP